MNNELDPKCPLPPVESVGYIEQLLSEEYFIEVNEEPCWADEIDDWPRGLAVD